MFRKWKEKKKKKIKFLEKWFEFNSWHNLLYTHTIEPGIRNRKKSMTVVVDTHTQNSFILCIHFFYEWNGKKLDSYIVEFSVNHYYHQKTNFFLILTSRISFICESKFLHTKKWRIVIFFSPLWFKKRKKFFDIETHRQRAYTATLEMYEVCE